MSYILDALKRAESERNGPGGTKPALPAAFVPSQTSRMASGKLLWIVPIGMLAVIAVAMLLRDPPSAATASAIAPVAQETSAQPSDTDPPSVGATQAGAIIPVEPNAQRLTAIASASAPAANLPVHSRPASPASESLAKSAPKPATKPQPELGTLRDLPDYVQREIPPLVIGGYLYSKSPADRTVLINNRLLHEGDDAAPGLKLERLLPDGMILSYREYRFRSTY